METIIRTIDIKRGEKIHITPLGDLHEDAAACNIKALDKMLAERARLKNHYIVGLGDFAEYIMPGDPRYTGRTAKRLEACNNIIDKVVEKTVKKYKDLNFITFGCGNHELKAANKYFTDPAYRIAAGLGVPYGMYCGRVILRIKDARKGNVSGAVIRILYHHGFGGSQTAGYTAAMKWAAHYPGWDLLLYGHVHQHMIRKVYMEETTIRGSVQKYDAFVVTCGTFLRGSNEGEITYSDKAGYPPAAVGAPLITATFSGSDHGRKLQIGVEI